MSFIRETFSSDQKIIIIKLAKFSLSKNNRQASLSLHLRNFGSFNSPMKLHILKTKKIFLKKFQASRVKLKKVFLPFPNYPFVAGFARSSTQGTRQADYVYEQRKQNPQLSVAHVLCTLCYHSCYDRYNEGDNLALLDLVI